MRWFKRLIIFVGVLIIVGIGAAFIFKPEYAYNPPPENIVSSSDNSRIEQYKNNARFDYFGETVMEGEVSEINKAKLSPENGAIAINDELLEIGRQAFYEETFRNEIFFTDIMGVVDGAFSLPNVTKAILALKGEGTTNLRVELSKDVTIGDKTYKKGTKIDTGLDVPKGSVAPLGMPLKFEAGEFKVGVSCAACHATLDKDTHEVIEGAPNADLNGGLVMALATNTAAYFTHGEEETLSKYLRALETDGEDQDWKTALPDPKQLEKTIDETISKWPAGSFDTTIDLKGNPTQIPDSFTLGDHPFGWSGFASVGPFHGLSVFNSNVHAQNSDTLAQVEVSEPLFGLNKEIYLGTILQNAASSKYRFDPGAGQKPSAFFESVDPNPGVAGVNEMIYSPEYPKTSLLSPSGTMVSSPGFDAWEQVHGMSAFQNSLAPPKRKKEVDQEVLTMGEDVFNRAGCISCHAGDTYTNNAIIPVEEIKTESSRAKSLKKTEKIIGGATFYAPNTPIPLPENPKVVQVPKQFIDEQKIKTGFAHGDSNGGYKVPSLIGLYWSAPYLHDGGVSVGENSETEIGVPETLSKAVQPDPFNSLRALVDEKLRQKVIDANTSSEDLQSVHVTGEGHKFWVDPAHGFTEKEQEALIEYLLHLE